MRALLITCPLLFGACATAGQPGAGGDDDPGGDGGVGTDAGSGTDDAPCDDSDNDGACAAVDTCPGADDRIDTDSDTVADGCDLCPGADDRVDADNNQVPDCTQAMTATFTVKVVNGNYWRGWISRSGTSVGHNPTLDNTFTGETSPTSVLNSYFVFSLAGLSATTVVDVKLRLEVYHFEDAVDQTGTETISVWDVTSPPDQVEGSSGTVAIHDDLQSGIQYGTFPVKVTDVNTVLEIPLDADAAAGVKAKAGQDFAIGLHNDTAPGYVLFSQQSEARTHELVVRYLP